MHLADASVQNHSTMGSQFSGIYNDSMWLWATVDTEDGKRYELIRAFAKGAAYDFMVMECPKDIWAEKGDMSQPHLATISFSGKTFNFQGVYNAAGGD